MAGLDLKVQMAAQFRDAAGRFARANPHDALAKMVKKWSARALTELREASPVDPGALRAGWRADFAPSQTEVRIGPRLRDEATSRRTYLATFTSPEQAL